MDSTITCPGCGATLPVQPGAVEITCQFCGTHFKLASTEGEAQLTPTPRPEMAAPDLSAFAPAGVPQASASNLEEPLPPPDPAPAEPYTPPTAEPPVVEQIPAGPPLVPPVTPVLPGQPPKRSNTTTWIIVAVVAVVLICLCCLLVIVAFAIPFFRNTSSALDLAWVVSLI